MSFAAIADTADMKWVIGSTVVLVSAAAAAAFMMLGAAAESAAPLPPDRTVEQVIPDLVSALAKRGPDTIETITAIGNIGNAQQPLFPPTPPTGVDATMLERWNQTQETNRLRRERIYALLGTATPDLLRLADDADVATRRRAIFALGAIRATAAEVSPVLAARALDTKTPSLERQSAIVALSRVDGAAALTTIESLTDTPGLDPGLWSAATWSLRSMGGDAAPIVKKLLTDPDPVRRGYVLSTIKFLRDGATPVAPELAASLTPELSPRLQIMTLRALLIVAPNDAATLERVVMTPAFTKYMCSTAGETLARRPGALAFDYKVCAGHADAPSITQESPAVNRALIAASGGRADLVVKGGTEGYFAGDSYNESPERVVVACIEPKGTAEAIVLSSQGETAKPVAPNELRIAAVRVAGDDTILDSTGGLINIETTAASCEKLTLDRVAEPTEWPVIEMQLNTLQPVKKAFTFVHWIAQLDVASRQWRSRAPALVYHLREDGSMFADAVFPELADNRELHIIGRWSGIDATVAASQPPLSLRYLPLYSTVSGSYPRVIVPSDAMTQDRWTRVVMYPANYSGAPRSKPVIPEGTPVVTMMGGIILPYEPESPEDLKVFWRKYLTHDHLSVRLMAASKLAELKDAQALPGIVAILTAPTDIAAGAAGAIKPFGAAAIPHIEPLLHSKQARVRSAAWTALASLGADAVPVLRKTLESGADEDRTLAVSMLKNLRPAPVDALLPAVLRLLDSCASPQNTGMKCYELLNFIRAGGAAAAPAQAAVEQLMDKTSGYQKVQAASTLMAIGGREHAWPVIAEIARTGGDSDAENALRALADDIKGDSLPVFVDVLQRRDAAMASAFAAQQIAALSPAPDSAYSAVAALLRDTDPAIRRRAMPALKGFRSPEATALLGRLMRDPDSEVRRSAYSLLKDRGIDAVPFIVHILDEAGDPLRSDLIGFLQRLGPPVAASAPAMRALDRLSHQDAEPGLRNQAISTLNTIRGVKPQ